MYIVVRKEIIFFFFFFFFFFQAEDGIRVRSPSRGFGDVYKRQSQWRVKFLVKRIKSGDFHLRFFDRSTFLSQRYIQDHHDDETAHYTQSADIGVLFQMRFRNQFLYNDIHHCAGGKG